MKRILVFLSLLVAWPCAAQAPKEDNDTWPDLAKEVPKEPKPLDPKIIAEWKKAGFSSGWQTSHQVFDYVPDFKYYPEMLPYFSVQPYPPGTFPKLTPPDQAFALTLYGGNLKDGSLKEFAGLTKLRKLTLTSNYELSGKGFAELATVLTDLQILHAYQSGVTDDGLKEICLLKSLRYLDVGVSRATEASLPDLVKLKRLQVLGVQNIRLTDDGLQAIAKCQNLRELTMANLKQTGVGLESLGKLKHLERLTMTGFSYSLKEGDLKGLRALTTLQWLHIYKHDDLTDTAITELEHLTKLRYLGLGSTPITSASFKTLAKITDLEHLVLDGTKVTDEHLSELAKLKNLKTLEIRAMGVTETGLKTILTFDSPNLKTVKVSRKIPKTAIEDAKKTKPMWSISY